MRSTRAVCGSMRSERGVEFIAHPDAVLRRDDAARPVTDAGGGRDRAGCRVDPGDGEVQRVGHPHRARGDRDARGPEPTGTGPSGWPVAGSIRWTVPSSPLATQTAYGPAAMPSGCAPTWIGLPVTVPVAGSIRSTVSSPSLATHTPPLPAAMATGRLPTGIVSTALSYRGADASYRPVAAVGDPHVLAGDGHRARRGPDRDLLHHGMGGRVDPPQRAVGAVHGPDRPVAVGQAGRAAHVSPRPPTRPPAAPIRPTLLAGKPVGSPAHGRATTTTHAAAATASAEPMTSRRRPRRRAQASSRLGAVGRRGASGAGRLTTCRRWLW